MLDFHQSGLPREPMLTRKLASMPSKTSGNWQPCHSALSPATSLAVCEHSSSVQLWSWAEWRCKERRKIPECSSPLEESSVLAWPSTSRRHQSCCSNWPTPRKDPPWSVSTMLCGIWGQSPQLGSPMELLSWGTAGRGESRRSYKDLSVSSSLDRASFWSNLLDGSCPLGKRNNPGASLRNITRTEIIPTL